MQELGEILYFDGKIDESESWFIKANKYSNYDYQEVVQNRVKYSLDTIKKRKNTP